MQTLSYGIEIELPVVDTQAQAYIAADYLYELEKLWQNKELEKIFCENKLIELAYQENHSKILATFDCIYSNLEIAPGPFNNLLDLHSATAKLYNEIIDILEKNQAHILNFSELPNKKVSFEEYKKIALPKTFYTYLVNIRKHSHYIGLDAKAQISPCTGIKAKDAVQAFDLITIFSPIFIALFANSPYENNIDTGLAENRLSIWQREFATSLYPEDLLSTKLPASGIHSFYDYFKWLFGTVPAYAISESKLSYKTSPDLYYLPSAPTFLEYLAQDNWLAKSVNTNKDIKIKPHFNDIILQQFSQFSDARIRFNCTQAEHKIQDFLSAFNKNKKYFDDYFSEIVNEIYIENRVAGSNCPDIYLTKNGGQDVVNSVHSSISVLQAGILRSSEELTLWLTKNAYAQNHATHRQNAIKYGIQSQELWQIAKEVLAIIEKNLNPKENNLLAYIKYVIENKAGHADIARKLALKYTENSIINWQKVFEHRYAVKINEN